MKNINTNIIKGICIFLIIGILSCQKEVEEIHVSEIEYEIRNNDSIYSFNDEILNGSFKFLSNDPEEYEIVIFENGIKEGKYERHFGNFLEEGNYENGKKQGVFKVHHKIEKYLFFQESFKDGVKHGTQEFYHTSTGKLFIRRNFNQGLEDGNFESYLDNGELFKRWVFRRDTLISGETFHKGNLIKSIREYEKGRKQNYKVFDKRGKLILKATYVEDDYEIIEIHDSNPPITFKGKLEVDDRNENIKIYNQTGEVIKEIRFD